MIDNQILASAERQAQLEAAKAAFFNSGGQITRAGGFPLKPLPPARSDKVDPDTILKRRRKPPTPAERLALRKLAEAL
ncbi:hypothetical protein [Pseudomonas fragi]|uniref:hypothetical protein n=1 Tax=Pseudomonas fragi TaxID=296 RepID=UPI000BA28D8B|nr:hypothetical protein [Pseudomonas fragi]PAA14428.1 hypothetical protein CJU74_15075 [Pseudomonas fragi]